MRPLFFSISRRAVTSVSVPVEWHHSIAYHGDVLLEVVGIRVVVSGQACRHEDDMALLRESANEYATRRALASCDAGLVWIVCYHGVDRFVVGGFLLDRTFSRKVSFPAAGKSSMIIFYPQRLVGSAWLYGGRDRARQGRDRLYKRKTARPMHHRKNKGFLVTLRDEIEESWRVTRRKAELRNILFAETDTARSDRLQLG